MKKLGIVLLVIILAGFSAGCINGPADTPKSTTTTGGQDYAVVNGTKIYLDWIHFYMYGMKTCPHCRRMKEEIPRVYGEDSLTYYELVDNPENEKLFRRVYQLTGIQGVPAIAITYNGTLYAVIEGEFNVNATPRIIQQAMANNGTFLVVGGRVYLLPWSSDEARNTVDQLYILFVLHRMPPENATGD